jgi:hypothetical protein
MCTVLLPPGVISIAVNRYFNIFESKPEGNRRRGRRGLRCLEDVGLREVKVKIWRQKSVDREEWASVIKGASALRRPQSQGVNIRIRLSNTSKINACWLTF